MGYNKGEEFVSLFNAIKRLRSNKNVLQPTVEELREGAEKIGTLTEFGNYHFSSNVKNRSAGLTVYVGSEEIPQKNLNKQQTEIVKNMPRTLQLVNKYIQRAPLFYIPLTMGQNDVFTPHCDFILSRYKSDYVRLAYMVYQTLFPRASTPGPQMYLVDLPEWQEQDRQILVFPDEGLTLVLGSDYYGEVKKGFLRMAMWFTKKKGGLGLHAGAKSIKARDRSGKLRDIGMIIFGLTATGKTTHTVHNHGLTGPGEGVKVIQDDVIFLHPDGSAYGSERGFYIKTEGLKPETQPLLYKAATSKDGILENIMVDYKGKMYFEDETLTGNGRGIIQRTDLGEFMCESLNLLPVARLDRLILAFITRRNTVLPIVSKLSTEQAASAFMLGESIESTGGDPKRAGESVRVVGTNPFIIGDEAKEGNWIYDFIERNEEKIESYSLNTGGVGEILEKAPDGTKVIKQKVLRVQIPEMSAIIGEICRGTIEWVDDPHFNTKIPKKVPGVDMNKFDLKNFYSSQQVDEYVKALRAERLQYIKQFKGLNPAIVKALE
ncbi:MAG: phosphoenolpyruvate carboxykinase [Promethearchaeati archaeon SRVP18_Atabeyarchaeia-1]